MKWILCLVLFCSSCTLINSATGEELRALPTQQVADVLHGVADDLVLMDTDGLITQDDWVGILFAVTNRVMVAWRDWDAEQAALEAIEVMGVDR